MTSDPTRLPVELRRRLQAELEPGERIAYAGQPDWRAQIGGNLVIFLFGLGWSAITWFFAVMIGSAALGLTPFKFEGASAPQWMAAMFLLFLIPFIAIGAVCVLAPVLAITGNRTVVHAITDRRLLTLRIGRWGKVESHPLSAITFVKRKDRPTTASPGRGTLEIGYGVTRDSDGNPRPLTET